MSDTMLKAIEEAWDNRGIAFHTSSNTYKLLSAIASEHERVRDTYNILDTINKIGTAEGRALDKLGFAVNLPRQTGEGDDRYRKRIILRYRLNSIEGTMDEIAQFTAAMVGVSSENIRFENRFDAAPATLFISAQGEVWDNSVLSREGIEEFAGQVVSAGHRVILEEAGTFLLTSDQLLNEQGNLSEHGLTSDAIETGGTLAADIVTDE